MRIISIKKLRLFWESGHGDAEQPLRAWYKEVQKAVWHSPADIKARYPSASLIRGDRVVFNIGGNKYRLIVKVRYDNQAVFIRFVGTHAEYDRVSAEEI